MRQRLKKCQCQTVEGVRYALALILTAAFALVLAAAGTGELGAAIPTKAAAYPARAATYPEAAYPEATYPGAAYPEATYPGAAYPEAAYPGEAYPEATYPEGAYPEGAATCRARKDRKRRMVADLEKQGYFQPGVPLSYQEQDFLHRACAEFQVPYGLALAIIEQETQFQNISNAGGSCLGYMQIMPRWHRDRMAALGVDDLMEPYGNFRVGCSYLAELLAQYGIDGALSAYRYGTPGSSAYSASVMDRYAKWEDLIDG